MPRLAAGGEVLRLGWHAQAGWFVVGLGRNGAEYSVLLIVALLCLGLRHIEA